MGRRQENAENLQQHIYRSSKRLLEQHFLCGDRPVLRNRVLNRCVQEPRRAGLTEESEDVSFVDRGDRLGEIGLPGQPRRPAARGVD